MAGAAHKSLQLVAPSASAATVRSMNGTTHAAIGAAAGAAASLLTHDSVWIAGLHSGVAAGGALLADLDHVQSAASRRMLGPLRFVLTPIVRIGTGGHRGATHTAVAAGATGGVWLALMEWLPRTHVASIAGKALVLSPAGLAQMIGVLLLVYLGLRTLTKFSASRPRSEGTSKRGWPVLRRRHQRLIVLAGVIGAVVIVLHYQPSGLPMVGMLVLGYLVGHLIPDAFSGGVCIGWPLTGLSVAKENRLVLGRVVTRYGRADFRSGWICLLLTPVLLAAHEYLLLGHSLF